MTFTEHADLKDDKIILDFMLENNLISEKDLNENPLTRELIKRVLAPAARGVKLLVWNQYSKLAMRNMFGGFAFMAYLIPSAALLATLIAAFFGIDLSTAIAIAKSIFYVGMTVGGAFIALMSKKAALKFINFINKNRVDKDIKNLEKNRKLTKADLETIKKIAAKYNTKKSLNTKELEKFKDKAA